MHRLNTQNQDIVSALLNLLAIERRTNCPELIETVQNTRQILVDKLGIGTEEYKVVMELCKNFEDSVDKCN